MASSKVPWGLHWRSHTLFIVSTVGIGLFTDLFLYGIVVPILPYMLTKRVHLPEDAIQTPVSGLLAAYAAASVVFSPVAGVVADRFSNSRQLPFLLGLLFLLVATIMFYLGQSIPVLVVSRILQGISAAFVWTIGLALVLDTVGSENLGKTVGSIFGFISIGELAAPILGGLVYDKAGYKGVAGMAGGLLAVDFILRALLIEKKTAKQYVVMSGGHQHDNDTAAQPSNEEAIDDDEDEHEPNEEDPLVKKDELDHFTIDSEGQSQAIRVFPILYCLSNPRLLVALLVALNQAFLLATFDATVPTVAQEYYGFSSLEAGLVFIPLVAPYVMGGPIAGWIVDKRGPKIPTVVGFGYQAVALILLRLTHPGGTKEVAIYCVLLVVNSVGLSLIGSPSVVEASYVVSKYHEANPDFFGANGPYAQLYALNSMAFCIGLAVGPIVAGALKDAIGYGNMNLVVCSRSPILFQSADFQGCRVLSCHCNAITHIHWRKTEAFAEELIRGMSNCGFSQKSLRIAIGSGG